MPRYECDDFYPIPRGYIIVARKKQYGFGHLLWDLFLVFITGGLWLLWLLIRHLRNG